MDAITKTLRNLAKSDYYQSLFSLGKELHTINIFSNNIDFSEIQMMFLKYLSMYSVLYLDIALGDIDDRVLENEVYEDSYLMYKNKKDKEKNKPNKIQKPPSSPLGVNRWIFKSPPKVGK